MIQSAFVLIREKGKILLLQEGHPLSYGLWCLPGGHKDEGETFEQAAIREAREEAGYEVEIGKEIFHRVVSGVDYRGIQSDLDKQVELKIFSAHTISGSIDERTDKETLAVGWFTVEEARKLPLRWDWLIELF